MHSPSSERRQRPRCHRYDARSPQMVAPGSPAGGLSVVASRESVRTGTQAASRSGHDEGDGSMRIAVPATGHQALAAGPGGAGDGGKAVDAALAASFVALATEPGMVSLAGGCYVSVWPADGEPVVVDGNVEMPGRGADPARFGQGVREVVTS